MYVSFSSVSTLVNIFLHGEPPHSEFRGSSNTNTVGSCERLEAPGDQCFQPLQGHLKVLLEQWLRREEQPLVTPSTETIQELARVQATNRPLRVEEVQPQGVKVLKSYT
jgi:hypothetical protein